MVWLGHPGPCSLLAPLGLPLFLPSLLAAAHPAHAEAPASSRGHWALARVSQLPGETQSYSSPWFPWQTSSPAHLWPCLHSWLTHCKQHTCKTQTLHQHSGNQEWSSWHDQRKKKKNLMWRFVFCFLIQRSWAAKQKRSILGCQCADLQLPFAQHSPVRMTEHGLGPDIYSTYSMNHSQCTALLAVYRASGTWLACDHKITQYHAWKLFHKGTSRRLREINTNC